MPCMSLLLHFAALQSFAVSVMNPQSDRFRPLKFQNDSHKHWIDVLQQLLKKLLQRMSRRLHLVKHN